MLKNYVATCSIDIIALLFLSVILLSSNMLNNNRKKPFLFGIVLTVIIVFSEAGTIFSADKMGLRSINIFCNVLGFALTPVIPIALIAISDVHIFQKHKLLLLPTLLNFFAAVFSPLLGSIFSVDANSHYERGHLFFIFIAVYFINLIFLVVNTLRIVKMNHYLMKRKMAALSFFTAAGTSIQVLFPSVYSSWHCITFSLLLYFLLLSEFDSSFDTLTGLYNRATFELAAQQISNRKAFSIIVLDINDFKSINDTYGHDYGDIVLQAVAATIRGSLDSRYACYRVGGDEFYIISRETNPAKIEFQLRNVTNALVEERRDDRCLPTIAYGYSVFQTGEVLDFHKMLRDADEQMYCFKKLQKAE